MLPSNSAARMIMRVCAVTGAGFHAVISLPPPPMSVYPFSMLMAPIYVGLLPAETAAAFCRIMDAPVHVRAAIAAALAAAVGGAHAASLRAKERFEYPPYFSWELGTLWVLITFAALAGAAIWSPLHRHTSHSAAWASPLPPMSRHRLLLTFAPALFPWRGWLCTLPRSSYAPFLCNVFKSTYRGSF